MPFDYGEDYKQRVKLTWQWDRLIWPRGLDSESKGQYRVLERNDGGESDVEFQPQWRNSSFDPWQSWYRNPPGRFAGTVVVAFPTLHKAQQWLDEAHANRPHVAAHAYDPAESGSETLTPKPDAAADGCIHSGPEAVALPEGVKTPPEILYEELLAVVWRFSQESDVTLVEAMRALGKAQNRLFGLTRGPIK